MTLKKAILFLALAGSVSAQTVPTPTKFAEVTSSVSISNLAVGPQKYYALTLATTYPVGLPPASYISATQLNTDFQSALAAYPSPQDPQEAILSTVLSSLIQKYPKMLGVTLLALNIGQTLGGIALPSGNEITVEILNTTSPTTPIFGFSSQTRQKMLLKR